MKQIFQILLLCLIVLASPALTSCAGLGSSKAIKCSKGKSKVRAKKFASKKKKKVVRSVAAAKPAPKPTASKPAPVPPPAQPQVIEQPTETASIEEPVEKEIISEPLTETADEPEYEIEYIPAEEAPPVEEVTITTPEEVVVIKPNPPAPREVIIEKVDTPAPPKPVTLEPTPQPVAAPKPVPPPKPAPKPTYTYKQREISKNETFSFNQHIDYIPNHAAFMSERDARNKLKDLADILVSNPDLEVTIIGNVGYDNFNPNAPAGYYDYGYNRDGEVVRIYHGRGEEVYDQYIPVSEEGHKEELIRRGIPLVEEVHVGTVMKARARMARAFLIKMGVAEKQVKTKRGTFFKSDKRHLTFRLKKRK